MCVMRHTDDVKGLLAVRCENAVQRLLHLQDLLRVDGNVGGLAMCPSMRLMYHHPCVRQYEPIACGDGDVSGQRRDMTTHPARLPPG